MARSNSKGRKFGSLEDRKIGNAIGKTSKVKENLGGRSITSGVFFNPGGFLVPHAA